jgi:hypothetical protein
MNDIGDSLFGLKLALHVPCTDVEHCFKHLARRAWDFEQDEVGTLYSNALYKVVEHCFLT